jgi:asparagine synthase (glutamine-hydrolysing)
MCGFTGDFAFNNADLIPEDFFSELLELSKHRGPDSTEVIRKDNFQLGFNRLAIIDLSANGNQPKCSPSKRYHIVFNGEIYNFKELAELHQLKNLKSSSDTEVIIHLLDKIGVYETIKLLNGMFAIAIVDTHINTFYLTRDFAGIKPLFYGVNNKGVVAASQFNQIFKHPWFKENLKLRPEIIKEYFGFGYMQAPNTVYDKIYQVAPGTILAFNEKGKTLIKIVNQFSNKSSFSKRDKPLTELKKILEKVLMKQMISDQPIATFLSGGIDSPIISSYAQKFNPNITAFTLGVNDEKINESQIAKEYAKHLNMSQQIISIEKKDVLNIIDEHFKAYSEPFGDYSSIPTYLLTKNAKKHYTVILSGDGGDELFLGYPRMLDVIQKRKWFKIPYILRKPIIRLTNKLRLTDTWAPYNKTFNTYIMSKHTMIPLTYLDKMFSDVSYSKEFNQLYSLNNNCDDFALLHQLRYNEFYAHMQRILIKVDRASMKNSMEVRVPFLDKDIIEYAWERVSSIKSKKDLKKDLKDILASEVPESLINKKKMGFTVPLYDWLHNELKTKVMHLIFEVPIYGEEILNSQSVKRYVQDFYDKKHDDEWGVWHVYAWQMWATEHVLNINKT